MFFFSLLALTYSVVLRTLILKSFACMLQVTDNEIEMEDGEGDGSSSGDSQVEAAVQEKHNVSLHCSASICAACTP